MEVDPGLHWISQNVEDSRAQENLASIAANSMYIRLKRRKSIKVNKDGNSLRYKEYFNIIYNTENS